MRRGFGIGIALGALLSIGLGAALALLPSTPTWALWEITSAIDRKDIRTLSDMIDLPAVTARAVDEFQSDPDAKGGGAAELGKMALALLTGAKVRTVFDDPDRPLEVTASDFLSAWWGMRREGDLATLTLEAGDKKFDLILEQKHDLSWKIVGVQPLRDLLRIETPTKENAA